MSTPKKKLFLRPVLTAICAGLFGFGFAACDDDNDIDDVGDNMEEAAEDTGDAIEEGAEDTKDAVEDATDGR